MKYVTIIDIARELGISKSTVSRALAGDAQNVKPETMKLVCETARRMGYQRNETAVNLRRQLSKTIGIVIPEAITSFFMNFIQCAQRDLRAQGYRTIIAVSNEDIVQERECLQMLEQCRVDGILMCVCHSEANSKMFRNVMSRGIPIVFFDRHVRDTAASQVHLDDVTASVFMVEKLIRSGCRYIVHLLGPAHIGNAADRLYGYREVLEKFNLPYNPQYVVEGGLSAEEGARAMERFIQTGLHFDAVFGFTETAVLGAKSVLQRMHFRIPEDVSLCCMSGTALCTLVHPTLSAAHQPTEEMAHTATRLLLEQLAHPDQFKPQTVVLPGEVVLRESTKPLPTLETV